MLGQLRNLSVHGLKIDGSFVRHLLDSKLDETIVKAIREVANAQNLPTIGEFASHAGLADRLCDLGVDYAQGEWSGMNLSAEDLMKASEPEDGA